MTPNLVDRPAPVPKHSTETLPPQSKPFQLNPVYSAVLASLAADVAVHLDDADGVIRAAIARVMLRISQIASDTVRSVLLGARERHRSPELCEALLESLQWECSA